MKKIIFAILFVLIFSPAAVLAEEPSANAVNFLVKGDE